MIWKSKLWEERMATLKDTKSQIEAVADNTLSTFEAVADAARTHLTGDASSSGAEVFASINTFMSTDTLRSQEKINRENVKGYRLLTREPAIARVTVCDEDGKKLVYYICRTAPVTVGGKDIKLASYRSPVGRLAALSLGDEFTIRMSGQDISVKILEKAQLHPALVEQEWDSRNTVLEGADYGFITVESFRELLSRGIAVEPDATLLEQQLEEEQESVNIREGRRRSVIDKMVLRDHPVLDRYQDEIFRLPLNSRLLILGAPGTGKTTTLIRRLGQKLDLAALDEGEQKLVGRPSEGGSAEHGKSWIMFTPTELLKQYVKEAFAREDIAAPDERICTWTDFRRQLARREFGILRSSSGGGSFVMRENTQTLLPETIAAQTSWFGDFDKWQKAYFWQELRDASERLSGEPAEEVSKLSNRIMSIMDQGGKELSSTVLVALQRLVPDIQAQLSKMKETTDKRIRRVLSLQVNRDRDFLDELAIFLDSLTDVSEDSDDTESDEEEGAAPPKTRRAGAAAAYTRAARSQARSVATKRSIGKATRTGRLIDWLGDRLPGKDDRLEVGQSLVVQSRLRRFVNPVRRYVDGVPSRYRRFRRIRQNEKRWYLPDGYAVMDIHPLEVDLVLLALLRGADEVIDKVRSASGEGAAGVSVLARQRQLYRNQILVDEATDFSPLQLGCMVSLAHPEIRSFFACGDFNQRVTSWGVRSMEEMKWVLPDIASKSVAVAYRQSRQLHDLAKQIIVQFGGNAIDVALSDFVDNEGVAPVLETSLTQQEDVIDWLARRIVEIESFVQQLPSIAILVNDEQEVTPLATALNEALEEQNIRVMACLNGQVMGLESDVRVFDVQHIKGLEFEAVFFIGVDRLAETYPDLFDRYLYVGATRAATYLGLTCERQLPESIAGLAHMFKKSWE
jgi:hypothetical protein